VTPASRSRASGRADAKEEQTMGEKWRLRDDLAALNFAAAC
jgi:hypothetical protein